MEGSEVKAEVKVEVKVGVVVKKGLQDCKTARLQDRKTILRIFTLI